MSTKAQRLRWRKHCKAHERAAESWCKRGYSHPPPVFPALPDDLRGLACGAKTRAGTPCKRLDIYLSGRCKLHGGLSTGPKTPEGKAKVALNAHPPSKAHENP